MGSKQFRFEFSRFGLACFDRLEEILQRRILKKLDYWQSTEDPLSFAEILTGKSGFFIFRVGDYRIIVAKFPSGEVSILSIVKIGHRSEVYED